MPKSAAVSDELAPEELTIIRNALNEVCNGVELHGEFETRIGHCSYSPFHRSLQLPASRINIPPPRPTQVHRHSLSRQRSPKCLDS